ncbi:hypothetical protein CR513_49618, partial [Mucuna pruriens]
FCCSCWFLDKLQTEEDKMQAVLVHQRLGDALKGEVSLPTTLFVKEKKGLVGKAKRTQSCNV